MLTKEVIVIPYQESWKNEFEKIKAYLLSHLNHLIFSIEHVGSTSVEGLMAKPIIDIDIIYVEGFQDIKNKLEEIGYTHEGDLGIAGREAFKYQTSPFMKHHLYVCHIDNKELKRHIGFRDYLKNHPEAILEYSQLKKQLSKTFQYDIDQYILGKTKFIEDIYHKLNLY